MHGVRIRENCGIDLLEGGKPNKGWLGPEITGEDGATFPEKLDWAIGEAKERCGISAKETLGSLYDYELLQIDEKDNMQILLYGSLAKDETDLLPGHIWVEREFLEVQNMKYYCPRVLQNLLLEQQKLIAEYHSLDDGGTKDMAAAAEVRKQQEKIKEKLDAAMAKTTPIKWVNRVIMWCADNMKSFGDEALKAFPSSAADAPGIIEKAMTSNTMTVANADARKALIAQYGKGEDFV